MDTPCYTLLVLSSYYKTRIEFLRQNSTYRNTSFIRSYSGDQGYVCQQLSILWPHGPQGRRIGEEESDHNHWGFRMTEIVRMTRIIPFLDFQITNEFLFLEIWNYFCYFHDSLHSDFLVKSAFQVLSKNDPNSNDNASSPRFGPHKRPKSH
jgi:hypothetical protein